MWKSGLEFVIVCRCVSLVVVVEVVIVKVIVEVVVVVVEAIQVFLLCQFPLILK